MHAHKSLQYQTKMNNLLKIQLSKNDTISSFSQNLYHIFKSTNINALLTSYLDSETKRAEFPLKTGRFQARSLTKSPCKTMEAQNI